MIKFFSATRRVQNGTDSLGLAVATAKAETSVKDTAVEISPTSSGGWKLRLTENGLGTSVTSRR